MQEGTSSFSSRKDRPVCKPATAVAGRKADRTGFKGFYFSLVDRAEATADPIDRGWTEIHAYAIAKMAGYRDGWIPPDERAP
jgi:hypothetical protein